MTHHVLHNLRWVITGTVVLQLTQGLGSKVRSQATIRYIKVTLEKSSGRPIYHFLTCQAQVLDVLLVLGYAAFSY